MEDKTNIIDTAFAGSVSFYCQCGVELSIEHGHTYTCSCGLTYHCKCDIKLLVVDWNKSISMDDSMIDQIRDAIVIAIERGPITSAQRYTDLLTTIEQLHIGED